MPQEIALYGEFTIRETMMYFGWIFGMCTAEIVERLRFLLQFLDLPSQNRLVKNLRYTRTRLQTASLDYVWARENGGFSECYNFASLSLSRQELNIYFAISHSHFDMEF